MFSSGFFSEHPVIFMGIMSFLSIWVLLVDVFFYSCSFLLILLIFLRNQAKFWWSAIVEWKLWLIILIRLCGFRSDVSLGLSYWVFLWSRPSPWDPHVCMREMSWLMMLSEQASGWPSSLHEKAVLPITWFFKFHFIAGSTFMEILLINKFSQLFLSCRVESKRRKVLWFQNFCHRNLREKSRTLFFILHKGIHWFMCFPIFLTRLLSCFFTHRF